MIIAVKRYVFYPTSWVNYLCKKYKNIIYTINSQKKNLKTTYNTNMQKKNSKKLLIAVCSIIIIIVSVVITGIALSYRLKVSAYSLNSDNISSDIKIVQISDLHYPFNDIKLEDISEVIIAQKPHFIALTGDIFDGNASKDDIAYICSYFDNIAQNYPVYYVLGNHEIGHTELDYFIELLNAGRIIYLDNEVNTSTFNGDKIAVIGVSDGKKINENNIPNLSSKDTCKYSVLLAHRPELFDDYCANNIDLILTGHTHGGQMRIFKQGLYAPNQGYFPRYSHGVYTQNNSTMIVNSGLSGSGRFYNPYEIGVITISNN